MLLHVTIIHGVCGPCAIAVSTNSDEHLILDLRRCQVPDGTTHQLDGFRSMMSIEEGDALQLAQIMEVAKDARLHNHDV